MDIRTVLVIDDEPAIAQLIRINLEYYGYKVLVARNGLEGVQMAYQFRPDLITLDINMPVMDGLNVLNIFKSEERLKDIPVIIVSINAQRHSELFKELGIKDCMNKPIDVDELVARVKSYEQ